jgi:hypothetical protein
MFSTLAWAFIVPHDRVKENVFATRPVPFNVLRNWSFADFDIFPQTVVWDWDFGWLPASILPKPLLR